MKTKYFLSIIMTATYMTLFAQTPAPHTFDFAVPNGKGDTIYYLITSPKTVAVSFRCDSAYGQPNSSYLIWYKLAPVQRNLYHRNLIVPDKVNWQSVEYMVTTVAAYTFYNVPLTSVSLPKGIDSIGDWNFTLCSGLKKLTLPDSLRYIGDNCFQTPDLEEVEMGDKVSHLGTMAFLGSGIRRFVCPPLLKKITGQSFVQCEKLSEVILPEGLDTIDETSFFNTPLLKHIRFPNTLTYVYGFNNSGLKEVSFPNSVHFINGFCQCYDLTSVEILGEVDSIGHAFREDTSLHLLDLSPTRLHTWKYSSLFNKTMRSIILPESLEHVEKNIFGEAAEFAILMGGRPPYFSLVLPENLKKICLYAWSYVSYATLDGFGDIKGELILKTKTPPMIYKNGGVPTPVSPMDTTRREPYKDIKVYVPCGSLEAYKSDLGWRYFYPNIREMDMVEVVLDSLCEYQIQVQYGFMPNQPGVYTMEKPAVDSLDCDTLVIYYVRNIPKSTVVDSSVQIVDDGTAFEWTWEGNGEEYDVLRNGDFVASVQEPFYRDTAVETGVQYCYNFIPYLNGCRGETSMTNCYTRVADTTGVDSTGVDSSGVNNIRNHSLSLYPNPAKQSLFLTNGERYENILYEITDVTGRIVMQGRYNAADGIRVSGLAKGIYLLRMEGKVGKFGKN